MDTCRQFHPRLLLSLPSMENSTDIYRISEENGREIWLIGTAHISQESKDLVLQTIEKESPDTVCVELDDGRMKSLENPDSWKRMDLKAIIKNHQLGTLIANLVLGSYQKRMGAQTGVKPGAELQGAVEAARAKNIPVILADRDIKVTLKRAWSCTPWYRKMSLLAGLFESIFDKTEVSEEELHRIKEQDSLNTMMQDFGKTFPEVKSVLIDERDQYLASRIRNAPGQKVLAVVGAGHIRGITKILEEKIAVPSETALCEIKKASPLWKALGWGFSATIIASIVFVGFQSGMEKAGELTLNWVLYTGGGALLGAIIAGAHPLAALAAFVSAPFTALTPLLGVGFVVALVQVYMRPPRVEEIENISEDIWKVSRWWKNRLTRVILCFLLPSFPAIAGQIIALMGIYKAL